MIFSTHRLTSVIDMDEIIVIREGRVAERGSHAELLALGGTYRQLWDDQLRHGAAGDDDDDEDDED
jgi:ATP-binding cassette subfamily B protein